MVVLASCVTASSTNHDQAIHNLSTLLYMHVAHPCIPLFEIRYCLAGGRCTIIFIQTSTRFSMGSPEVLQGWLLLELKDG